MVKTSRGNRTLLEKKAKDPEATAPPQTAYGAVDHAAHAAYDAAEHGAHVAYDAAAHGAHVAYDAAALRAHDAYDAAAHRAHDAYDAVSPRAQWAWDQVQQAAHNIYDGGLRGAYEAMDHKAHSAWDAAREEGRYLRDKWREGHYAERARDEAKHLAERGRHFAEDKWAEFQEGFGEIKLKGNCCCCIPIRIGVFILALILFLDSMAATFGLFTKGWSIFVGGFDDSTKIMAGLLGSTGVVFSCVGMLGAYEMDVSYVRMLWYFSLLRVVFIAAIWFVDMFTLETCESWQMPVQNEFKPNPVMKDLAQKRYCPRAKVWSPSSLSSTSAGRATACG